MESLIVAYLPRYAPQRAGLKLHDHEYIVRHIVLRANPVSGCRYESEARVVRRMTEDDHGIATQRRATIQTLPYEGRANALALMLGYHGHRTEPHQHVPRLISELHGREQNVPYD